MGFINFHNHSEYSFLSSLLRVDDLVGFSAYHGFRGCAVSDTLSTYGYFNLTKSCRRENIKPVYGIEIFVRGSNGKGQYPVLLVALNNQGLHNIFRINSLAHQIYQKEKFYTLPFDAIHPYREGLAALVESELYFNRDHPAMLEKTIDLYQKAFPENFYVEVNYCGDKKVPILKEVVNLVGQFNLKAVACAETRYSSENRNAFDFLNDYRQKSLGKNEKGLPINTDFDFRLRKKEDFDVFFKNHPDYLKNGEELFEKIDTDFDIKSFKIPHFFKDPFEKLKTICLNRLNKRSYDANYHKRLDYELGIINKMQLSDYFLLIFNIVRYMRRNSIPFGAGRGSAVSSFVLYLLGVTKVDPLKYNLLFERFLNPSRKQMPDIDMDICWKKRKYVFSYISAKFGKKNVARLAAVDRLKARSVMTEISKTFKLSPSKYSSIMPLIPRYRSASLETLFKNEENLKNLYDNDGEVHEFMDIVTRIEGIANHSTVHSAGTLIIPDGIKKYASQEYSRNGELVAQITKDDLDDTGFIKFDILGLRFITIIEEAMKRAGIKTIDYEDQETYSFLGNGDTTAVFQLESSGMKDLLRKIKPRNLLELSDVIALYRPGPMRAGMTQEYVKRHDRHPISAASLSDENLIDNPYLIVTYDSYGLFIYQEQILLLAHDYADMSWDKAESLRKALSNRDNTAIVSLREDFLRGCKENKIDEPIANKLYGILVDFGSFSFNKSHSVAYAYNAFAGAFLKLHHPLEFFLASLNNNLDSSQRLNRYLMDIKFHSEKFGIGILPIDINKSRSHFSKEDERSIRCGLSVIKYIGPRLAVEIVRERKKNGDFADFVDFTIRMKPKGITVKSLEFLIKAGSFDTLGRSREVLLDICPEVSKFASKYSKKEHQSEDLFKSNEGLPTEDYFISQGRKELPESDKFLMELEATDIILTHHPLDKYLEHLKEKKYDKLEDVETLRSGVFIGYLFRLRSFKTRKGLLMASAQISDRTGTSEVVLFPSVYKYFSNILRTGSLYLIHGKVQDNRIMADKVFLFDEIIKNQ